MTREELLNTLTELGTIEDPAERRSKIVGITEEINSIYDSYDTVSVSETKLKSDIQKLKDYNMELYLQVGGKKAEGTTPPEEDDEELTYDKLFNEQGELK